MSQISLNSVPAEPIDLGTGNFTPPFTRFINALLISVNLANAAVTSQVIVPVSGGSIIVNNTALFIYLNGSSATGSYTIGFPPSPIDGSQMTIKTKSTITTLSLITSTPDTILDPVTTLAALGFVKYTYLLSQNLWVRS